MKKLVKVEEVEGEGLIGLLGKQVMVWCMNFNYHGTLVGVNGHDIKLEEATVVFETGPLGGKLKDAQKLPSDHYVRMSAIESYCEYAV